MILNFNNQRSYIIAEAGVNHNGSLMIAKKLIDKAKYCNADAIKFQTYRAHAIATRDSPAYWDTEKEPAESQYQLFKKFDKFWKNEFEELKTIAKLKGFLLVLVKFVLNFLITSS